MHSCAFCYGCCNAASWCLQWMQCPDGLWLAGSPMLSWLWSVTSAVRLHVPMLHCLASEVPWCPAVSQDFPTLHFQAQGFEQRYTDLHSNSVPAIFFFFFFWTTKYGGTPEPILGDEMWAHLFLQSVPLPKVHHRQFSYLCVCALSTELLFKNVYIPLAHRLLLLPLFLSEKWE